MPHGPDHAVNVAAAAPIHGISSFGAFVILRDSGCPDSMRSMSGSGPLGPILAGVWQSWHADVDTMYLPRSTGFGVGEGAGAGGAGCAQAAVSTRLTHAIPKRA